MVFLLFFFIPLFGYCYVKTIGVFSILHFIPCISHQIALIHFKMRFYKFYNQNQTEKTIQNFYNEIIKFCIFSSKLQRLNLENNENFLFCYFWGKAKYTFLKSTMSELSGTVFQIIPRLCQLTIYIVLFIVFIFIFNCKIKPLYSQKCEYRIEI